MSQERIFFNIFGQVWTNQGHDEPRREADVIKVRNTRNGLVDSDIVGENQGNYKEAGWYSLTLADLSGQGVVMDGDILELGLYAADDHHKKIYDFGRHTITADDILRGGIMMNFDLAGA